MINLYYDNITQYGPVANCVQNFEFSQGHLKFPIGMNSQLYRLLNPVTTFYNIMKLHDCEVNLYTDNNFTENLFYPIEVYNFINIIDLIPVKTFNNMKNGIIKVLILFQEEGADGYAFSPIKKIAELLESNGIDKKNIYIVISDLNLSYKEFFEPFKIASIDWWQIKHQQTCKTRYGHLPNNISSRTYDVPLSFNRIEEETFDIDKWTNPSKLFLSFNGHCRVHRTGLVSEILLRNLENFGYLSFGVHPSNFQIFDSDARIIDFSKSEDYIKRKIEKIRYIKDKQLIIDGQGHDFFDGDDRRYHSKYYYDSAFSIITETFSPYIHSSYINNDLNVLWTTEKTWKPIAIGHPFIILGSLQTMLYLRSEGYYTFEELFNFSYDYQYSLSKRIDLIVDNVERLSLMSKKELNDILESLKPKLKANKELFYNKNHSSKFYKLFKELLGD